MKKFLLETAKIVGTTTKEAWSQVHSFSPTQKEKLVKRGQILAVISLSELGEEVEAVSAGKEIISRLHEEYYGHLEKKAFDQLRETLEKVVEETREEAKVEVEAAVLVGETIYFAVVNQGQILIQREGQIATILTGEEGRIEVASGSVIQGDIFLLGSEKFFSLLDEETIKAALATSSVNEAAESLMPMIHGQEKNGTAAAAVLKLEKTEETEPETIPAPQKELVEEKPARFRGGFKQKIIDFFKKIVGLGQLFLFRIGKKLKRRAIYLEKEEKGKKKPQRTLMTVAVILLVLLVISVVLGARQRSRRQAGGGQAEIFKQAQIKKEEGEALIELNPIRARELLLEARDLLDEIEPEEVDQSVLDFQKELEEILALVMREHEVEPRSYYDLGLIKDEAKGDDWAVSGNELIIFDKDKKTIYSLGVSDKKSAIVTGGDDLVDGQEVGAFLPKIYLLTERGILEYGRETRRQKLVVEADEDWGEIIDLRAFGGNLYLLDKKGEIWKYPGVESGFGAYRLWLEGDKPDFGDAVGMAIDGSVWVLKKDGTILKYVQGRRDFFALSGLDQSLSNPTAIFTDDDQDNLYILDKGNSRVVVINKSGEYHSQYHWDGMGEVTRIMASEEEKKILLLAGSKVYEIEIK